MNIRISDWFIN